MSSIYDLTIKFSPSADYRRVVWVLTIWAIAAMYYVHLPWGCRLGLGLSMVWGLISITRNPRPYPKLQSLSFQQGHWVITQCNRMETYNKIRICVDSGFFLLGYFSGNTLQKSRFLVIFHDQIKAEQRKILHRIETIHQSEHD